MLATQSLQQNCWRLGFWCAGVIATSAVVILPGLPALGIIALWCLLLCAFTVGNLLRLSPVFAAADTTSHLIKRLIFLFGHQPPHVYFTLTAVPAAFLIAGLTVAAPGLFRARLPKSAVVLVLFLCWSLMITLWSPPGIDWQARAAAIHQQLVPALMFFLGLISGPSALRHTAKVLIVVAGISVAYGVIQFLTGPTVVETVWAESAYGYSIQAAKVYAYLHGANQEFRPFSIYADPLTWGLLLVAMFTLSQASKEVALLDLRWARVAAIFAGIGLLITLTRTPWLALAITVLAFRAFVAIRSLRRPSLIVAVAVLGFWAIVNGGRYVLEGWSRGRTAWGYQSRVVARYATVGTLSARVGAGDTFVNLLGAKRFLGEGLGYNSYHAGRIGDFYGDAAADSHNFVVEMLLYLGLPGLCLFVWFYWQWLSEIFKTVATGRSRTTVRFLLWIVGFSLGSILAGYLNGMTLMSSWFFFLLGAGARVAWLDTGEGHFPQQ